MPLLHLHYFFNFFIILHARTCRIFYTYKYIECNAVFIGDVKLTIILKFNKRHRDSQRLNYFV